MSLSFYLSLSLSTLERSGVRDLKAAGIPVEHLQRYIHAHRCKYCEANLGRAGYQCQTAKQNGGGDLVISTIVDPLNPRTAITKTLADQHEVTSDPSPDTALRPFKTLLKGGPLNASVQKQLDEMQACVTELDEQQQETPIALQAAPTSALIGLMLARSG